MAQRVFMTRPLGGAAQAGLEAAYSVAAHRGRGPVPRRRLLAGVRGAEGLVCFPYDSIDAEVIDAAPDLRVISTHSVGYDHVDVAHAASRGIRVGYTPGVLTDATADLAFGLVLDVTRRITEGDRDVRAGRWRAAYGPGEFLGRDLRGMVLGILGMGRIGAAVARRARVFGMGVIYHNRHRLAAGAERRLGVKYASWNALLGRSDVLSLHVPHTPGTDRIMGAGALARMKEGAYLVNTSRGRVVDEAALVRALKGGRLGGAALDVFESEPVGRGHPLARLPNVVLAPHIGSATAETRARMAGITVENLRRGMAGRRPLHWVDP